MGDLVDRFNESKELYYYLWAELCKNTQKEMIIYPHSIYLVRCQPLHHRSRYQTRTGFKLPSGPHPGPV